MKKRLKTPPAPVKAEIEAPRSTDQAAGGEIKPAPKAASTAWAPTTKYIVAIFLFAALLAILYLVRDILSIVIFAALLAFLVQPIVDFFMKRAKLKKGIAVVITYFIVMLVLILMPLIVIPAMVDAFNAVVAIDYRSILNDTINWIQQTARSVQGNPVLNALFGTLLTSLSEAVSGLSSNASELQPLDFSISLQTLGTGVASALGLLVNVLGPIVSGVLVFIFTLLISLQMSMAKDDMGAWLIGMVPEAYRPEIINLANGLNRVWSSFLRGELNLMIVIGLVTWLGNLLIGTPQALFLAIIAGLLELVPNLGPVLATIPAVILALVFGSSWLPVNNLWFALVVIILYTLIQMLENQFVVPYVLGDAMDLPPVVVLVGCLAGGAAFGVLGVFLATPVIASGRLIFGYLYHKLLESPPPPPEPAEQPGMWDSVKGFFGKLALPGKQK